MDFLSIVLSSLDKVTADRAQAIVEERETGEAVDDLDYFLRQKKFEELRHPGARCDASVPPRRTQAPLGLQRA